MEKSKLLANLDLTKEREAINYYEFTLHTIASMMNIIEWNMKGRCSQGKKLVTSSKNAIQPNTEVTPDIVIEVNNTSGKEDYRAVNEITVNLPKDENYWIKKAEQLKKYDDELIGWENESTNQHDILFTTNAARTFAFNNYIKKLSPDKQLVIERNLSILQSIPMEQKESFIFIKKEYGEIGSPLLDDKLSNGVAVAKYNIVRTIDQMKFYDSMPPIVYTMVIIWNHILKTFLGLSELRQLEGNKIVPIPVTVEEVRSRLSRYAPESNTTCIRKSWVKDALLGFVEVGLAKVISEKDEKFEIRFRKHRGEILEWLLKLVKEPESETHEQIAKINDFIQQPTDSPS